MDVPTLGNNSSATPTIPPLNTGPGGAWLLWTGLGLFVALAAFAGISLLRTGRPSQGASEVHTAMTMKRFFLTALLVAALCRSLAMAYFLARLDGFSPGFVDAEDVTQKQWADDLVQLCPSVVFLSAFSLIVLFWAQLHNITTMVPLPLLDFLFVCLNIACYLVLLAIAVCTYLLQAYDNLRSYMLCVLGFLHLVVAFAFSYYGIMVYCELRETSRKRSPTRRDMGRILALSVICPVALMAKGTAYLAWDLSFFDPSLVANSALCLASEWLPACAALCAIRPPPAAIAVGDALGDSSGSEAPATPLMGPSEPAPGQTQVSRYWPAGQTEPGTPPHWRQLWPEPREPQRA